MTTLPSMNLYIVDFEGDTAHLSFEEDGVYNRLLRLCWRTPGCSVPDDPVWIARMMRADATAYAAIIEPIISEFFERKNGRVWQRRQRKEYEKAIAIVEGKRAAGAKGANARWLKEKENVDSTATDLPLANAMANGSDTTDLPLANAWQNDGSRARTTSTSTSTSFKKERTPLPPKNQQTFEVPDDAETDAGFVAFKQVYPRLVGLVDAQAAWHSATLTTPIDTILAGARRYAASLQGDDPQFITNPAKWLRDQRWTDQLPDPHPPPVDKQMAYFDRIIAEYPERK